MTIWLILWESSLWVRWCIEFATYKCNVFFKFKFLLLFAHPLLSYISHIFLSFTLLLQDYCSFSLIHQQKV